MGKLREGDKAMWQGLRVTLTDYWPSYGTWSITVEVTGQTKTVKPHELTNIPKE